MYCSEAIDSNAFVAIISSLVVSDQVRIFPFMFTPTAELKVVCPCCIMDKRVDNKDLAQLTLEDPWVSKFKKEKAKKHIFYLPEIDQKPVIESGFSLRPIPEVTKRYKYGKIDTPSFRELGFKGYKFDKNIFFPVGAYMADSGFIRIGIPNPNLLNDWPVLQRAVASWIFRVREVPPIDFPDVLPVSSIGDIKLSEPLLCRNVYTWNKQAEVSPFFPALLERSNKKQFLKLRAEHDLDKMQQKIAL